VLQSLGPALLFILVVCRTGLFDGWHIPLSPYLIFAVSGIQAVSILDWVNLAGL